MILPKRLVAATAIYLFLALPTLAMDEDNNAADGAATPNLAEDENSDPKLEEAIEPKAIRASIVNGLIDVLGDTRRASIDLTWEMLPLPQMAEFEQEALSEARKSIGGGEMAQVEPSQPCGSQGIMTITIANEDIGTSRWLPKLSEDEKICLQNAFALDSKEDLEDITDEPPAAGEDANPNANISFRQSFRNFWIEKNSNNTNVCDDAERGYADRPGCGRELIKSITVPEYYRMRREYFIVSDLLRTKGIAYSLDLDKTKASPPGDTALVSVRDRNAYIFYEGIDWEIDIVRRTVESDPSVSYYRLGAKAVTRNPIEFQFQNETNPTAAIGLSFRNSDISMGVDDLYPEQKYEIEHKQILSDEVKAQLETAKSKQSINQLDISFASVTGVSPSQIASKGFLGGVDNSSIIAGGLVGNDEIQSLVGTNLEIGKITDNVVPGLLFGLSPRTDDATLFLGPSIRVSVFTLATGARFFEFDDGVRIRPAGVVSLDLSRILSNEPAQKITVEDPNLGRGWFELTGLVAQDLSDNIALLGYTLQQDESIDLPIDSVKLFRNSQQCTDAEQQNPSLDCQPENLPVIKQNIELSLNFNDSEEINFLPKGIYSLKVPDGYLVKDCIGGKLAPQSFNLANDNEKFVRKNWIVIKQENVASSVSCN